jgi:hypothetical protein
MWNRLRYNDPKYNFKSCRKHTALTSVSILKDTWRAMTMAAASWSNPEIKSYKILHITGIKQ